MQRRIAGYKKSYVGNRENGDLWRDEGNNKYRRIVDDKTTIRISEKL